VQQLSGLRTGEEQVCDPAACPRHSHLDIHEQRSLFSLWVIARSPLFMGGDLLQSSPDVVDLLTNQAVLDVNSLETNARQLFLNCSAGQVSWKSDAPKDHGDAWVAVFNIAGFEQAITVACSTIFPPSLPEQPSGPIGNVSTVHNEAPGVEHHTMSCDVVDLWRNVTRFREKGGVTVTLPRHGSGMFLLKGCRR